MAEKKLSFTVEDAKVIAENPDSNFAVLSLDFFASGENLHELYVSEDTLMRTADTIKNCPIVWKYDEKLNDIYTHDKDEVPCGFVPENSKIKSRKLSDGRTMLSVVAYVWKRYTGELLKIFKRDGGRKPVSVEMSVYDMKPMHNGLTELVDFKYEGITVLGSFITPAIPLANATVLSFAQIKNEYEEDLKKEFSSGAIDMEIPQEVKDNAKKGLEAKKGTPVELSFARYLIDNITISPEKARRIVERPRKLGSDVSTLLWGGEAGIKWAQAIVAALEKKENLSMNSEDLKASETKGGKTKQEIQDTYLGAETLGKEEQSMEKDVKKVEEVKEEKMEEEIKEEETKEEEEKEEEMAESVPEVKEENCISNAITQGEIDKEEEQDEQEDKKEVSEEVKMALDVENMLVFMTNEAPLYKNMNNEFGDKVLEIFEAFAVEISKGKDAVAKNLTESMLSYMKELSTKVVKLFDETAKQAGEIEVLNSYKKDVESEKFNFEVDSVLAEAFEAGVPKEKIEELREDSKQFALDSIDTYKNMVKAKAFVFVSSRKDGGNQEQEFVKIGLPFTDAKPKSEQIWQ